MDKLEVWDKKEFNDNRQALSPEFCNMMGSTDFTFKMHYLVILDKVSCASVFLATEPHGCVLGCLEPQIKPIRITYN